MEPSTCFTVTGPSLQVSAFNGVRGQSKAASKQHWKFKPSRDDCALRCVMHVALEGTEPQQCVHLVLRLTLLTQSDHQFFISKSEKSWARRKVSIACQVLGAETSRHFSKSVRGLWASPSSKSLQQPFCRAHSAA